MQTRARAGQLAGRCFCKRSAGRVGGVIWPGTSPSASLDSKKVYDSVISLTCRVHRNRQTCKHLCTSALSLHAGEKAPE